MEVLLALVMGFEGFSPVMYNDADQIAIGYGHYVRPGEYKEYKTGVTLTRAKELLVDDLVKAKKQMLSVVKVRLTRNQRLALTSLVYNIGIGVFKKSKGLQLLNRGMIHHAAIEFFDMKMGFVKSEGKILPGLQRRRMAERQLFWKPSL